MNLEGLVGLEFRTENDFERFMAAQVNRVLIFRNELENKLARSVKLEEAARKWVDLKAGQFRSIHNE